MNKLTVINIIYIRECMSSCIHMTPHIFIFKRWQNYLNLFAFIIFLNCVLRLTPYFSCIFGDIVEKNVLFASFS